MISEPSKPLQALIIALVLILTAPGVSYAASTDTLSSHGNVQNATVEPTVISISDTNVAPSTIPPIADAGPDQTVHIGTTVHLDGSASSDPNDDLLTYTWLLLVKPADSAATLIDPTTVNPTITADTLGDYVIQLIVNDGTENSAPDTVTASAMNAAPVADAGPDQTATVNSLIQLDGSGSSDIDGDPLTFSWSMLIKPSGSTATLSDPTIVNPTFTADKPGDYGIQLIVNDGTTDSSPDTITISTNNTVPIANAGPDQTILLNTLVQLNGSGSTDLDGDPLTYSWSIMSKPADSSATLTNPTSIYPTFTADKSGDYVIQLIVNDGFTDSAPDTITVSTTNSPPTANAGPDQIAPLNALVQLDGSASSDIDGDPLTFSWSMINMPETSDAALSNTTLVNPTFLTDEPGTYTVQLIVNDGTVSSAPDTVTISTSSQLTPIDIGVTVPSNITQGDTFQATVYIDPTDASAAIGSWQISLLNFTKTLVSVTNITAGSSWASSFTAGTINNTAGNITDIGASTTASYPTINHTACTIQFSAIASGSCTIAIVTAAVSDDASSSLTLIIHNVKFTILASKVNPPPRHHGGHQHGTPYIPNNETENATQPPENTTQGGGTIEPPPSPPGPGEGEHNRPFGDPLILIFLGIFFILLLLAILIGFYYKMTKKIGQG
jgi:hypothetical protein